MPAPKATGRPGQAKKKPASKSDALISLGKNVLLSKLALAHPVTAAVAAIVLGIGGGAAQVENVKTQSQQAQQADGLAVLVTELLLQNRELQTRLDTLEKQQEGKTP